MKLSVPHHLSAINFVEYVKENVWVCWYNGKTIENEHSHFILVFLGKWNHVWSQNTTQQYLIFLSYTKHMEYGKTNFTFLPPNKYFAYCFILSKLKIWWNLSGNKKSFYIVEISKCRNHWIKRIYMTLKLKIYVMKTCSYVEWILMDYVYFFWNA